ncbi:hypothetical protein D3C76_971730 [compost metagenome]
MRNATQEGTVVVFDKVGGENNNAGMLFQLNEQRGTHGVNFVINPLRNGGKTLAEKRIRLVEKQNRLFIARLTKERRNILRRFAHEFAFQIGNAHGHNGVLQRSRQRLSRECFTGSWWSKKIQHNTVAKRVN